MLQFPAVVSEIIGRLREQFPADFPIYLVGGAIRDALLNRHPIQDLDFVLQGDALALGRQAANALGAAYFPLDPERGSARLLIPIEDGKIKLDFSVMRGPDLETDLRNRDFTVNAIAQPLHAEAVLIDPLGGVQHVRDRLLVECADEAFLSDPIRVVRGVRLAVGLGFKLAPTTTRLMRQAARLLPRISSERIRDELFHILDGPHPAAALRLSDRLDSLPFILPELTALKGLDQPPPHVLDAYEHSLDVLARLGMVFETLSLAFNQEKAANWAQGLISVQLGRFRQQIFDHLQDQLNPDRSLRSLYYLAGLYHDAGKQATRQVDDQGRLRFLGHEKVSAELAVERARQLRLSNDEIERIALMVQHHMRPLLLAKAEGRPSRRAIYRFYRSTGAAGIGVGLLSLADVQAIYGAALPHEIWIRQLEVVRVLFEAWWERPEEAVAPPALITGDDLIELFNLKPGPQIGALLEYVREAQAVGQVSSRSEALHLAEHQLIDNLAGGPKG